VLRAIRRRREFSIIEWRKMNLRLFTAAALFLGSCGLVQADSIVYDVKYGPTMVGGVEVKSEALITLTNGHIAVTLINPGTRTENCRTGHYRIRDEFR